MDKIIYEDKKKLEKDIKFLDIVEYKEILKILIKNKQKYSCNNTGIFFNLKYIDNDTLAEVIKFVNFCRQNREIFESEPDRFIVNTCNGKKAIKNDQPDKVQSNQIKKTFEFKLESTVLHKDLDKYKDRNSKELNFSFKNYLDKISIISNKEFGDDVRQYPVINDNLCKFEGVNDRLFKKCKNIDRQINKNESNEKNLERDV